MSLKSNFLVLLLIACTSILLITLEFPSKAAETSKNLKIAIVSVITNTTTTDDYDVALKSVECYANVQNYKFLLLTDSDYRNFCNQSHKFFLRHCIIAHILPQYDYILFVDADHGVVNPKRRIEEFLNENLNDLTFYDRFFDWEVMAGTYIAKNSQFSINFLNYWANFESKMPRVKHGSDNSALHMVLAEHLFNETHPEKVEMCREVYYKATNHLHISTYIACIRNIFGERRDFGRIRIIRKGMGWSRDDWLTSGLWNLQRDFMLHGWKTKNLQYPPKTPIEPVPMNYAHWYNPLAGPIVLEKCVPGNSTWHYNPRLLGDSKEIEKRLEEYARQIERKKMKTIGTIYEILEST